MSTRARSLSEQLEASFSGLMTTLESLPDDAWATYLPEEEKTLAALVHHIAWALQAESEAFRTMASGGGDSGWTQEWLDAVNREQAETHAHDTRDATLQLLRRNIATSVEMIRDLSDTELDRRGKHMPGEPAHSVAEWIGICLLGHPRAHLPSIESLLG